MLKKALKVHTINDGRFRHIVGQFVQIDTDSHSNPSWCCQLGEVKYAESYGNFKEFEKLQIWSQSSKDIDSEIWSNYYGFELRYRDLYSVTLSECEMMAKTLKRIEKNLSKYSEKFGNPETVSDYIFQIAIVEKCEMIVFKSIKRNDLGFTCFPVAGLALSKLRSIERGDNESE